MKSLKVSEKIQLKGISSEAIDSRFPIAERLFEMGFHAGLEIEILHYLKVSKVIVVGFGETIVSLTEKEFLCLKY